MWENWRDRVYAPAARAAGVEHPVPYDLRHSFVSLLIHEGLSVLEVARQAGHSPKVCLDTYAHVFDDFDPAQRTPAEAAIRQARDELVPVRYPLRGRGAPREGPARPEPPVCRHLTEWAILDSNQGPLPYQRSALTG